MHGPALRKQQQGSVSRSPSFRGGPGSMHGPALRKQQQLLSSRSPSFRGGPGSMHGPALAAQRQRELEAAQALQVSFVTSVQV